VGATYEVFGRRYQILGSADGYRERGLASWYGEAFHGRPTANGETFDMHALSAAHRTLPLDTWVEVVNLDNGRRLVLRINDRGPFAHVNERIIDLSYAAALELGVVGPGTARVDVRALTATELASQR
jgi:rare lipoprotein A